MCRQVKIQCIKIKQPIGEFFIGSISYKDLVDMSYSDIRRIEQEKRDLETYLGIQRPLSSKRVKELAVYVNTIDACFPTSVILYIPDECITYDEKN